MIFIDADKPPYAAYLDYAIRLSRKGTVIVADNVVRNGAVLDASSKDEKVAGVQKVNFAAAADSRITATIIQQVGIKEFDGMLVAVVN
jgi:caffeoyl-CoA O-methyltransferase